MARSVTTKLECGCKVEEQAIPRTLQTRTIWTEFCLAHDAEEKALRVEADRGYRVTEAERALRREFT